MPDVKISPASIVIALALILILGAFGWLTFGPRPAAPPPPVLTSEAKRYIGNLNFSNVHIQAAESMVNQRLVEILGDITNKGNRTVQVAEVTCIFHDYTGKELQRERVAIIGQATGPLNPGATHAFRLAFDDLAEGWNQSYPTFVIAQIQFE
ncbi:MAG: hypothetical protein M3N93_12095 [Acidobacteriota bacterium]|nr:hypothetical protein [Acidobacteriota bacterium]